MGAPPHTPRGNRKSSREGSLAEVNTSKKKKSSILFYPFPNYDSLKLSFVNF
jgi:hypothetical protein